MEVFKKGNDDSDDDLDIWSKLAETLVISFLHFLPSFSFSQKRVDISTTRRFLSLVFDIIP